MWEIVNKIFLISISKKNKNYILELLLLILIERNNHIFISLNKATFLSFLSKRDCLPTIIFPMTCHQFALKALDIWFLSFMNVSVLFFTKKIDNFIFFIALVVGFRNLRL